MGFSRPPRHSMRCWFISDCSLKRQFLSEPTRLIKHRHINIGAIIMWHGNQGLNLKCCVRGTRPALLFWCFLNLLWGILKKKKFRKKIGELSVRKNLGPTYRPTICFGHVTWTQQIGFLGPTNHTTHVRDSIAVTLFYTKKMYIWHCGLGWLVFGPIKSLWGFLSWIWVW